MGLLILLFLGGAAIVGRNNHKKETPPVQSPGAPSESTESGDQNGTSPAASPSKPNGTPTTQQQAPAPLSKPILIKSSGNNGPVPSGAAIEFVCSSDAGIYCQVVLTSSTGREVKLGEKLIQPTNMGLPSINWVWAAEQGDWKVIAQARNNSGSSSQSDQQTLTVR